MLKKVVLIHTVPLLIDTFSTLAATHLPGVRMYHILNEVLVERVRLNNGAGQKEVDWLSNQVESAEDIGASAVLVTCTILSSCVDQVRQKYKIPIVTIDEEMVRQAVDRGERIGVIVTNPDTIEPSSKLILDYAAKIGKKVTIKSALVEKAFDAVRNGNGELHDQLVKEVIIKNVSTVDVIILAQASMARVLNTLLPEQQAIPILSSPYLAFEQLRSIVG